ncbi:hypothetical protein UACE39S_00551 [Ureibacillus acetophenoni]|uniref:hypothetical protein n=1 Tax=Ureibacillus sp. MALMAid1270 TaxID=3411629 RepID=UPI003BA41524
MYSYEKVKKYEDCGCKKTMGSYDWKKEDQLDDIKDLLKKILHEKKEDKKDDKKDHKKDHEECDVVTVTFDLDDHQVEFVSPNNGVFGCSIIVDETTITEATQCLLSRGFKIVAFVAATEPTEAGDQALGTYTFVRCR